MDKGITTAEAVQSIKMFGHYADGTPGAQRITVPDNQVERIFDAFGEHTHTSISRTVVTLRSGSRERLKVDEFIVDDGIVVEDTGTKSERCEGWA